MIVVTGATGTTGSRVAKQVRARGVRARPVGRHAAGPLAVRFDWSDPGSQQASVTGAEGVYVVPPTGGLDPAEVMPGFFRIARDHGVRRAVLLSSSAVEAGGPGVGLVAALLPEMFEEWAVLRPSWFMQNVTGDHHLARGIREHGTITTAAGDGKVAFVDADDVAEVATDLLLAGDAPHEELVLTGPETLTYDQVADLVGAALGKPVTHERVDQETLRARLVDGGLPEASATVLAYLDSTLAEGAEDRTTDAVERVTGHAPRSFADFAKSLAAPAEDG